MAHKFSPIQINQTSIYMVNPSKTLTLFPSLTPLFPSRRRTASCRGDRDCKTATRLRPSRVRDASRPRPSASAVPPEACRPSPLPDPAPPRSLPSQSLALPSSRRQACSKSRPRPSPAATAPAPGGARIGSEPWWRTPESDKTTSGDALPQP